MASHLQYYVTPSDIQNQVYTASPQFYISLFGQHGGHLPYFQGMYSQAGYGILGDLWKNYALPVLHKAAPHIFKGISGVLSDAARGRNVKQSVKRRGVRTLKKVAKEVIKGSGGGKKRKAPKRRKKAAKKKKKPANGQKRKAAAARKGKKKGRRKSKNKSKGAKKKLAAARYPFLQF